MEELHYPDEPLADGVVALRPWTDSDLSCVEQAAQDPRIPEGTTVPARYTRAAGRAFLRRQHGRLTDGEGVSLAITRQASGEAVGLVTLLRRPQPGVAGLGYWIVPAARRQGLGRRAVALVTTWGLTATEFVRVEAWVEPRNAASRRILAANGYAHEGRLRHFLPAGADRLDLDVFSRPRHELAPAEPGAATPATAYDDLIAAATAVLNPRSAPRLGEHLLGDDQPARTGRPMGQVGCALRTATGRQHLGVCIDTGSGTGFCAEHAAVAAMVTAGEYRVARIVAVWRDTDGTTYVLPPCGRCREFLRQIDPANLDTDVVLGRSAAVPLRDLLPHHEWPPPLDPACHDRLP